MGDDDGIVTLSNMLSWMGALIVAPPGTRSRRYQSQCTDDFEDRGGETPLSWRASNQMRSSRSAAVLGVVM